MKVLVIDVGGTNVKVLVTGKADPVKIPSGPEMSAARMVESVKAATKDWEFDAISIGYPGPVVNGKLILEPKNLPPGWVGYDFAAAFGKPVKIINDAAMQALGAYDGGRMLFLGLGTGLGTALVIDGVIAPLELGHLPYKKKKSYEEYVGVRGMEERGKAKWRESVKEVVGLLKNAFIADYVVLGGGNARKLLELPQGARLGDNKHAFIGGFRLWDKDANM